MSKENMPVLNDEARNDEAKAVNMSNRLRTLADMVTVGNTVADVGCDHGFVSIYLIQNRIAPSVLAMDVRTGPLMRAKEHVSMYGLEKSIETRLSDGLDAFEIGEAQTCIIAGMGGKLMTRILQKHKEKTNSFRELILQPQSELEEFREFLRTEGFEVVKEDMLVEEGKFYFFFKVHPPKEDRKNDVIGSIPTAEQERIQKLYDRYGKGLLTQAHPVTKEYLLYRKGVLEEISGNLKGQENERTVERYTQVLDEMKEIENVLAEFFS